MLNVYMHNIFLKGEFLLLSKKPVKVQNDTIVFRVTPALKKQIQDRAFELNIPVSSFIKLAIGEKLKEDGRNV